MNAGIIILVVAVIAAFGFILGRRRALSLAATSGKKLHSPSWLLRPDGRSVRGRSVPLRPDRLAWTASAHREPRVRHDPDSAIPDGGARSLVMADVRRIAEGLDAVLAKGGLRESELSSMRAGLHQCPHPACRRRRCARQRGSDGSLRSCKGLSSGRQDRQSRHDRAGSGPVGRLGPMGLPADLAAAARTQCQRELRKVALGRGIDHRHPDDDRHRRVAGFRDLLLLLQDLSRLRILLRPSGTRSSAVARSSASCRCCGVRSTFR